MKIPLKLLSNLMKTLSALILTAPIINCPMATSGKENESSKKYQRIDYKHLADAYKIYQTQNHGPLSRFAGLYGGEGCQKAFGPDHQIWQYNLDHETLVWFNNDIMYAHDVKDSTTDKYKLVPIRKEEPGYIDVWLGKGLNGGDKAAREAENAMQEFEESFGYKGFKKIVPGKRYDRLKSNSMEYFRASKINKGDSFTDTDGTGSQVDIFVGYGGYIAFGGTDAFLQVEYYNPSDIISAKKHGDDVDEGYFFKVEFEDHMVARFSTIATRCSDIAEKNQINDDLLQLKDEIKNLPKNTIGVNLREWFCSRGYSWATKNTDALFNDCGVSAPVNISKPNTTTSNESNPAICISSSRSPIKNGYIEWRLENSCNYAIQFEYDKCDKNPDFQPKCWLKTGTVYPKKPFVDTNFITPANVRHFKRFTTPPT